MLLMGFMRLLLLFQIVAKFVAASRGRARIAHAQRIALGRLVAVLLLLLLGCLRLDWQRLLRLAQPELIGCWWLSLI